VYKYRAIVCAELKVGLLLIFKSCYTSGCLRGSVVERRSLTGELPLSCARPVADG